MPSGKTDILSEPKQLSTKQTSMPDLLLAGYSWLLAQKIDYDHLKRDYPGVEFIGLVGFDIKRQKFVLVKMGNQAGNSSDNKKLSEREQEVLQLVAMGYTNFQIAIKLTITENTVKAHLQNIFAKLKVKSRTEAAMHAAQRGWVTR